MTTLDERAAAAAGPDPRPAGDHGPVTGPAAVAGPDAAVGLDAAVGPGPVPEGLFVPRPEAVSVADGLFVPGVEAVAVPGGLFVPGPEAVAAQAPAPRPVRAAPVAAPVRRSGGDPVKALLHRHRDLCDRAVDPLEIAAGLEAHGITDRTAARFRHRDIFSLAEELYARTPRGEAAGPAADPAAGPLPAGAATGPRALRGFGFALLPGALALGAAGAGQPWAGAAAAAAAVAALVWPGRAAGRFPFTAHLLAAAAVGWAAYRHGPALAVALAVAVAPGHLVAAAFAARARSRLAGSRGLGEFADRARPLLAGGVAVFTAAAAGAAALAGASLAAAVPLAVLLFLVRLLLRHGAGRRPVAAALALALVPVPAAALAAAAGLLVHAFLTLSRASAHARP
ncbi:hypothetical protein [Streptomyces sp. H27-S2]|uniref:hypothetical protein n=1 Tax=Streptomyces antarcticus TaxID=2996458 RepID=UPI00226F3119|nr:hypothetical protein [Streptomyces sp. H27-S2]MCY0948442.1 hypothetical protein [Streptomyces sp. H27-S2]